MKILLGKRDEDPIRKERQRSIGRDVMNKLNSDPMNEMKSFLNKAKSKSVIEGIFYIMKFTDMIKVGICYCIEGKLDYHSMRMSKNKPISSEVYVGAIYDVALYECEVRMENISIKRMEYFSLDDYDSIKSNIPSNLTYHSTQIRKVK